MRGVLVVGGEGSRFAIAEEEGSIVAYTHWYYSDEDLKQLADDLKKIKDAYRSSVKHRCMVSYYEYDRGKK